MLSLSKHEEVSPKPPFRVLCEGGDRAERVGMPPSPNPLPLKGERAYSFFLSPLPVGEGWVRAFLVSLYRVPREGGDPDPFTQTENGPLAPSLHRVIASEAKQPSGRTRTSADVPLGCFGAMRLAMTRKGETLFSRSHPQPFANRTTWG